MPPGGLEQFPDQVPWSVPIFQMSNWWLTIDCRCGEKKVPLRLLAARIGWRITLREIVPFLRCATCRERPSSVQLVDVPIGDIGKFSAKTKTYSFIRDWTTSAGRFRRTRYLRLGGCGLRFVCDAVHDHVERLVGGGWNEIAGEELEVLVADQELVQTARIPTMQSSLADRVWHIEIVEQVCAPRFFKYGSHPGPRRT